MWIGDTERAGLGIRVEPFLTLFQTGKRVFAFSSISRRRDGPVLRRKPKTMATQYMRALEYRMNIQYRNIGIYMRAAWRGFTMALHSVGSLVLVG